MFLSVQCLLISFGFGAVFIDPFLELDTHPVLSVNQITALSQSLSPKAFGPDSIIFGSRQVELCYISCSVQVQRNMSSGLFDHAKGPLSSISSSSFCSC